MFFITGKIKTTIRELPQAHSCAALHPIRASKTTYFATFLAVTISKMFMLLFNVNLSICISNSISYLPLKSSSAEMDPLYIINFMHYYSIFSDMQTCYYYSHLANSSLCPVSFIRLQPASSLLLKHC